MALANAEWWLGRNEDARRRLQVALAELPAAAVARPHPAAARARPDRARLRPAEAEGQTTDARDDARAIGDPVFEAAALACGALARRRRAAPEAERAPGRVGRGARAADAAELATRLPAFWMHARARRALGRFDAALADLERGTAIAGETGRESVLLVLTVESVATLIELGRLAEANAAAERRPGARAAGRPPAHAAVGAQRARAARLAAGDVPGALRTPARRRRSASRRTSMRRAARLVPRRRADRCGQARRAARRC